MYNMYVCTYVYIYIYIENNIFVYVGNKIKWDKYILFVNNYFYNGCFVLLLILMEI